MADVADDDDDDDDDDIKEDWLVTYADAVTLLMAFFVMILNFTKFDIAAYQEAVGAIAENIGGHTDAATPITELQIELQDVTLAMEANKVVEVHRGDDGVVIDLTSGAFFNSGTADVRELALPVLQRIVQVINAPVYDYYNIEVEGHTDDDPISTARFPSNWELSANRASAIVRVFAENGIVPWRLKAAGYGATRPRVPNRHPDGRAIEENQELNRRITVHVRPMDIDEQKEYDDYQADSAEFERQRAAAEAAKTGTPTEADPGDVSVFQGVETAQ